MRKTISIFAGLVAAVSLTTAAPASANNAQADLVQTMISKMDLTSTAGIQKVYKNLQRTSDQSCRTSGSKSLVGRIFEQKCAASLLNDFIVSADHDGLAQLHKKSS